MATLGNSKITDLTLLNALTIANGGTGATTASEARTNLGLKAVASTGSYNDLSNKPTIPTVNNATLTIQKNSTNVATFTANSSANVTANISVPTKVSELTNDSGFTTNKGTVTSVAVKMNNTTKGTVTTSGTIDLGTVITSETSLSKGTTTGSGNAVTDITVSGHTITLTKGTTFLTSHQDISGKTDKAVLTTKGDMYYASAASTPARLQIGSNGNFLTISGGVPTWGSLPTANTTVAGITKVGASGGAAAYSHTHSAATTSAAGLMSAADKEKLDGIATGANNYTHPTGDGNLHVPATGTSNSGKVLTAGSTAGSLSWTTPLSIGTTSSTAAAGNHTHGLTITTATSASVTLSPNSKYTLTAGGKTLTFATPVDTTYSAATTSAAGLMSAADKEKLNGIASGANNYTHPTYTSKSSGLYKITVDGTGHVSAATAVAKADITALGIPGSNTDEKVKQTLTTTTGTYYFLATPKDQTTTSTTTSCFNTNASINLNTGKITAGGFIISGANTGFVKSDGSVDSNTYSLSNHNHSSTYKAIQTAVSSPSASGTTVSFIDTISQNTQGVISATKKTIPNASTSTAGIIKIGTSGTTAAAGDHEHEISITTSTESNISLQNGAKYTLSVGSNKISFTMPQGGGSGGGTTTNSLTFNNSGSGATSGTTFNGSAARTISYNTIGAAASSHTHGNITNDGKITTTERISTGDKLVFSDSSDSNKLKVLTSSFNSNNSNYYLSQNGTFQTIQLSDPLVLGNSSGMVIPIGYTSGTITNVSNALNSTFTPTMMAGPSDDRALEGKFYALPVSMDSHGHLFVQVSSTFFDTFGDLKDGSWFWKTVE